MIQVSRGKARKLQRWRELLLEIPKEGGWRPVVQNLAEDLSDAQQAHLATTMLRIPREGKAETEGK